MSRAARLRKAGERARRRDLRQQPIPLKFASVSISIDPNESLEQIMERWMAQQEKSIENMHHMFDGLWKKA